MSYTFISFHKNLSKNSKMKRKLNNNNNSFNLTPITKKQLRSNLPRRRRLHISPFPFSSTTVDSSAFAPILTDQISCHSSIASVCNNNNKKSELKRRFDSFQFSDSSCVEESVKLAEVTKSEVSSTSFADNFVDRNEISSQIVKSEAIESCVDLTCWEEFSDCSDDDDEEEDINVSSSAESKVYALSDLEAFNEYMPSFWVDSGSQFSGKEIGEESVSPTLRLFTQFKSMFCRSSFASTSVPAEEDCDHSSPLLGLECEEDEESYRMLRRRERSQVYLRDYAGEYCNTAEYGDKFIRQRLDVVHWIVEQVTKGELQMETMFLGVSLFDRFLSLGYFKDMKNIQIAGIACLTLATRIEENQPYNCVQTETFSVGKTTYLRCEVVAMEWLVMEVLNFKCFLPTLYNFLWYYLKAARANKKVEKTTKYLAVLALMGHEQLCFWPSIVAAGVVVLACIAAKEDASSRLVTAIGAKEKDESLHECIESLEWLVKYL